MNQRTGSLFFWTVLPTLTALYIGSQLVRAGQKPLWLDEYFCLGGNLGGQSFGSLLIRGADAQSSAHPLFYLISKALIGIRDATRYFYLPPFSFYRLVSIISMAVSGFWGAWLFWHHMGRKRLVAMAIVIAAFAPLSFWVHTLNHHQALEMRPYSLWGATWFAFLGHVLFRPGDRKTSAALLTLVAMTASASVFQIIAAFVGTTIVERVRGESWRTVAINAVERYLLPSAVALYYIYPSIGVKHGYTDAKWGTRAEFLAFWIGNSGVGIFGVVAAAICFFHRDTIAFAAPSIATLVLFLMGPFIFWQTRSMGYFFIDRQYLYYAAAFPIFLFTVGSVLATWWPNISAPAVRWAMSGALVILLGWVYIEDVRPKIRDFKRAGREASLVLWPRDSEGTLATLLRSERPNKFCTGDLNDDINVNVEIFTKWMTVRFPGVSVGEKNVRLSGPDYKSLYVDGVSNNPCLAS